MNAAMLEKIRKTLAMANDAGASEQERETAMRMAHGLLAKHNLTMAQVEESGAPAEERRGVQGFAFYDAPWSRTAAYAIARLCFCEMVREGSRRGSALLHFIGRESNVATAAELARFVINSIRAEARQHGGGRAGVVAFAVGASVRVSERCEAMRRDAEAADRPPPSGAPGTALVLADVYRREKESNIAVRNVKWPRLATTRCKLTARDGNAYHAGRAYGDRVSLNRQIGGAAQRRIAR